MHRYTFLLLIGICFLSFFFTVFQQERAPVCFNADEAAFTYNAYSILHTLRDEYGTQLPLRLKSFGDYKLPLYSYLSIPFVALFGLNEMAGRALNAFVSLLFPGLIYFLAMALFKNVRVALLAAFFVAVSLGLHIVARHAHEAYLAAFLISATLLFFIRTTYNPNWRNIALLNVCVLLSLFAYQSSRIFAVFFFIAALIYVLMRKIKKPYVVLTLIVVIGVFAITDLIYNPARVKNLLIFNSVGFSLNIQELKTEGGIKPLYNVVAQGIKEVTFQHLSYFSPQYFITQGDENSRFGYKGMSLITPVELLFLLAGFYYLFSTKNQWRYVLTALFVFSPLSASLSWNGMSLTRSLFFLIPTLLISAYGVVLFYDSLRSAPSQVRKFISLGVIGAFFLFLIFSWDFYIFHYSKRALIVRSWQCGYKELAQYVKKNYDSVDRFYITPQNGQPYIFMLFYLQYPPDKYQKLATLSPPDQYGFGQVEKFDKFVFSFKMPEKNERAISIGFPDDFTDEKKSRYGIKEGDIQKIRVRTEDMFLIYNALENK